jgi:hypothetical protein
MRYSALLLLVLTSCVAKPIISDTACNDPLYLELKKKPIETMTAREFAYYQAKDRECEEAHDAANAVIQLQRGAYAKPIDSASACSDPLYLKLKSKPIDSMTEREFAYYLTKDRECEVAQTYSNGVKQLQNGQKETAVLLLAIDGVLAVGLALLLILK